jgi:hypothetical protein
MYVQKTSKTPRFEVDFKQRLEQQREAVDAVRLPRLGFQQYRIYDIEEAKDKQQLNGLYGQHIGHGIRQGPLSVNAGSSTHWTYRLQIFIDDLAGRMEPSYTVKWLKPKHATLLRMKGHRVEPAQPGDRTIGVQYTPVRLSP